MIYLYLLLAVISLAILIKITFFRHLATPDFTQKTYCNDDDLLSKVYEIAYAMKEAKSSGSGLSVRLIEKTIKSAQITLSKKSELLPFEKEFYDNYRALSEELELIKSECANLCDLPHFCGLPRIYHLCELIVKSKNGYVGKEIFTKAVTAFCEECPLNFAEIKALPIALSFALLELATIFASKITVINKRFALAERDAKEERINANLLKSASYLTALKRGLSGRKKRETDELLLDNGIDFITLENGYISALNRYAVTLNSLMRTSYEKAKWLNSELVLSLSPLYKIYSECEDFSCCDEKTKEEYLRLTAEKAQKKRVSERRIAMQNVAYSKSEKVDLAFAILPKKASTAVAKVFYLSKFIISIGLSVIAYFALNRQVLGAIASFFPLYIALSYFTDKIALSLAPKRILPRKQLKTLEKSAQANLVCTRLIASIEEVKNAVFMLKVIASANPSNRFSYTLLADFPSSNSEKGEVDEKLLSQLRLEFSSLDKDRFNILVRKRKYFSQKKTYQGWERKRGALLNLNGLILRNERAPFELILGNSYEKKYIVALDADTYLSTADELLCTMEHPYNKEVSVLTPSISHYPAKSADTLFKRYISGANGLDAYTCHSASLSFDAFCRGNYTGKGIYRVKEFDERVNGAFLDGKLLSHDFIEGAYANCAESDIKALDAYPSTFSSYLSRSERWLRGDWQLLPWLCARVKNQEGKRIKNPLCFTDRWHIFHSLLASLFPLFSLIMLFINALTPNIFYSLIALSPFIVETLLFVIPHMTLSLNEGIKALFRVFFAFITLPVTAIFNAYSIGLTIVRVIRNKNLLEWRVFAHGNKDKGVMLYQLFATVALFILNLFFVSSVIIYAIVVLFVLALPIESLLSETPKRKKISAENENALLLLATKTWNYFVDGVTAKTNYLPPDNYSEISKKGFENRTSPTNIGMALCSACSACELKIIDKKATARFIALIVNTVYRLKKHKGIPYNWYDINTLEPLYPRYLSSVDVGNLLCSLMLARAYAEGEALKKIDEIINAVELDFLYDEEVGLLRIGYSEDNKSFDGHYDLAGSEALCTYLCAIGLGKIPKSAFYRLSTRKVKSYGHSALYSWTGGAFEYLMPTLFFEFYKGGLFDKSAASAVKSQLRYAKENDLKYFGVSESQYPFFEDNGDYKYKAFGVPSLALSSEEGSNIVAPYASILCLRYAERETNENLLRLVENKLIGKYGAYESTDGKTVVRSFMAHHQGMVMCAICNYLRDNALIKSLSAHPSAFSADTLLFLPNGTARGKRKILVSPHKQKSNNPRIIDRVYHKSLYNLLSFRGYHLTMDENGRSFSHLNGYDLTRRERGFMLFIKEKDDLIDLTANGVCRFYKERSEYIFAKDGVEVETTAFTLKSVVGEARKIVVRNKSERTIEVSLIGAVEPVLARYEEDLSHREYSNMFLSVSHKNGLGVSASRKTCPFSLALTCDEKAEYSGSRAMLYGRRQSPHFSGVLDACLWAETKVKIAPKDSKSVCFYLVTATDESRLISALKRVKSENCIENEAFIGGNEDFSYERACAYATVISSAVSLYRDDTLKSKINQNLPTVALEVTPHSLQRVKEDIKALATLYRHGFGFNLALLYSERHGYMSSISSECAYALSASGALSNKRSCCSVLTVNGVDEPELYRRLLESSINLNYENEPFTRDFTGKGIPLNNAVLPQLDYALKTGKGGFLSDGAYAFDASVPPPKPWCNIIANETFGTVITDGGGGYTFEDNARESRLTKWNNDAVLDEPSEFVLLCERGNLWSPTRTPIKKECKYLVEHGFGYSRFKCNYNGFITTLTQFIGKTSVKYYELELENMAQFTRSVDIALALDVVLGDFKQNTASSLWFERQENRLYCVNSRLDKEIFVDCTEELKTHSFSFRSLMDESGKIVKASANETVEGSQIVYCTKVRVGANESKKIVFCLSCGAEVDFSICDEILKEAKRFYSSLSCVQLKCNDKALEFLYKWLPYQTLCSRFWGRTGFYQSSGAYGFRDQLQDTGTLNYINPLLTKEHILRSASRQFEKGDVMHWWHEGIGGVRTHFTDDRLFLPLAVADYIAFTGECEILSERIPFLRNVTISDNQKSVYENPSATERRASLLEHCRLAINSVEINSDGLVLMKGGDWNDGMDKAGEKGRGVTVFGTMLLYLTIKRFMPYFANSDEKCAMLEKMQLLKKGVEKSWQKDRFARLVTDEGIVLGTENSPECKIDILTQAFGVISETADSVYGEIAISTADERLVDEKNGIIKLLSPPIKNMQNIGYISEYPEGVRENGGQYTHASIWFIIANFMIGKTKRANELLRMINPVNHSINRESVEKYKLEPYVVSADIYSGVNVGEGGWSWYTGSASWFYRCITEHLLGVKIVGKSISFNPKLDESITDMEIKINSGDCRFVVKVDNSEKWGEWRLCVNGVTYNSATLKFSTKLNGQEITLKREGK